MHKVEGVVLDSYYFTEFGLQTGDAVRALFNKHNKNNKLWEDLEDNSISLRWKGMATVGSALGHVLDKVYNIFISKRKKASYFTITTEDGFSIEVSPNLEILTQSGYVPACRLQVGNSVMTILNSTFNFKSNGEDIFIDINQMLEKYSKKIEKQKYIYLDDLDENEKKIVYMLGFKIDKEKKIHLQEFLETKKFFGEKQKKTKIEGKEVIENKASSQVADIVKHSTTNYQYKKIVSIEVKEKEEEMVFNINTAIAENLIINNFIIKQNC